MRLKFPIFIQKFAKKAQLKCSVRAISIAPYRTFRGPLKFLNIRVSGKHMGSNVCPEVRRAFATQFLLVLCPRRIASSALRNKAFRGYQRQHLSH